MLLYQCSFLSLLLLFLLLRRTEFGNIIDVNMPIHMPCTATKRRRRSDLAVQFDYFRVSRHVRHDLRNLLNPILDSKYIFPFGTVRIIPSQMAFAVRRRKVEIPRIGIDDDDDDDGIFYRHVDVPSLSIERCYLSIFPSLLR